MAENYGGPVWHASGRGKNENASKRIALAGIVGVGDPKLGQWVDLKGVRGGIVHVQRRLTDEERETFEVPEPYDIRGTEEEQRRIAAVLTEAPYLVGRF